MSPFRTSPSPSRVIRFAGLVLALGCAAPVSQAAGDWVHDVSDYPSSPLCKPAEVTLWTCTARHQTFSLCAQRGPASRHTAIQYRVRDRSGRIVLRYPDPPRAARSAFTYLSSANGDAEVDFSIGAYGYSLVDPLRDVSFISVVKDGKEVSHLSCDEGNQSLQLNDTIALVKALGLAQPR